MIMTVTAYTDDDGNLITPNHDLYGDITTEIDFPAKYEVCPRCEGTGKHDHPSFNGFSADDLREDPEFAEAYFAGRYDVTCETCNGLRVVLFEDTDRMDILQKHDWALYQEQERDRYHWEAVDRRERAMGY